ncbi:MAG: efflux transporter periplasmic adaptor subunit [Curvibacter sp. GWA2_64_110]|nr:MAG: efflux transporter periplasmic adaptor subunit [Curvibacter sp. GWA2_64_110]HCY17321.1 efflux RND transporter periplasmic adaptor subunit [Curvibacter sp.]
MIKFAGKTRWVVFAVLLALALAGLAAFSLRAPRAEALLMQPGPLVRTLQFSARVATLSRVDVGSTLTGRVAQVLVREGAQVRAGEVLIRLETDELNAALAQAVAAERQADATLQAAQATLQRGRQLVAQGFYSAAQLDEAQRAVDVAVAQRGSARAAVAAARARLTQAVLVAPADARVLSRQVEPGQIVQPGKALLSLALTGPTQLVAQVDERFLDQLQTGQQAAVVADAFAGQRFAAKILSIAPVVDAQRGAIEVKFTLLQEPPAFLREDMTLSVEVETGRREQALALPLTVLRQAQGDTASVLVAVDGVAQERKLRLGLRTLAAVEVLDGLRAGDAVLTGSGLKAGQRVSVSPVAWQPGAVTAASAQRADSAGSAGSALSNAMGR